MTYLEATATVSACGLYRYDLTRTWANDLPTVVFCMLNPSTADGAQDDPTIRRCVGFAKAWGYGKLVVVNLFAYRATDPAELTRVLNPIGPENDRHISSHASGRLTICAWGASIPRTGPALFRFRHCEVKRNLREVSSPRHLGLTKGGHPRHPLYLPADCVPLTFPENRVCNRTTPIAPPT